jgi:hypothetical protein
MGGNPMAAMGLGMGGGTPFSSMGGNVTGYAAPYGSLPWQR